jgi:hypothetical protein
LISRNSITPSRAFLTIGDLVVKTSGGSPFGPGRRSRTPHSAGGCRLRRPSLHLDQTHAAVAGDRQPLVETEARNLGAGLFARLQQREMIRDLDLFSVDFQLCHLRTQSCRSFASQSGEQIL